MSTSLFNLVFPVTSHTDYVMPGGTFVAVQGAKEHGIKYIAVALEKGAKTIIVEQHTLIPEDIRHAIRQYGATLCMVVNARQALAHLSAQAFDYPAKKLICIAVTGTKGKTTSCFLLEYILRQAGYKTALISSACNTINGVFEKADLTTPQPDYLHAFLAQCVKQEVKYVIIEAAAQALSLHRLDGIIFSGVLFTNFDQAHGEFYSSIEDYFAAKASLVQYKKPLSPLVINGDNEWCMKLVDHVDAKIFAWQYQQARYKPLNSNKEISGNPHITFTLDSVVYECPQLAGWFNSYNVLGVVSLLRELHIHPLVIQQALKTAGKIPGRMEKYELPNGAYAFIDKAHNVSSFQAVLPVLKEQTDRLIVVFGAGGERDRSMRPKMGKCASLYADIIILTSDDPRSENIDEIIQDIYDGIDAEKRHAVHVYRDREEAIKKAYECSARGAIIALLGKGSEEYQEIGGVKYHFSEREIIASL